jgi:DNA-binding NarL/FixJ family response regulator
MDRYEDAMNGVDGLISWIKEHPRGEELARKVAAAFLREKGGCENCLATVGSGKVEELLPEKFLSPEDLTPRQLSILRGMVDGKTNHELATELGFSVSTVRHETMRIYQILAVSDRREAAKAALALAII